MKELKNCYLIDSLENIGAYASLGGNFAKACEFLARGDFAVVNVYIDEDLDAWRAYEPNYPRNWYCGYEPDGQVRSDRIYNVRAIPSLYLLGEGQRILMKDAPVERVVAWLQNQQNQ